MRSGNETRLSQGGPLLVAEQGPIGRISSGRASGLVALGVNLLNNMV
jgi:hypothetical protein